MLNRLVQRRSDAEKQTTETKRTMKSMEESLMTILLDRLRVEEDEPNIYPIALVGSILIGS